MNSINLKKQVSGNLEEVIQNVTDCLKEEGFGILTRIDLHTKIKEKTGKDLRPTVILGACNPQLAYEAYSTDPDVSSLLPCNAVVREVGNNRYSVELAKPSGMMRLIDNQKLFEMGLQADSKLERVLTLINSKAA